MNEDIYLRVMGNWIEVWKDGYHIAGGPTIEQALNDAMNKLNCNIVIKLQTIPA